VDGKPLRVGYLSQLRISSDVRHHIKTLGDYYRFLLESQEDDEAPYNLTTVMAGNTRAQRLLTSDLPGMPVYLPCGDLASFSITPTRKGKTKYKIIRATPDHLKEIENFLNATYRDYHFAPIWTANDLVSEERTRGLSIDDFMLAFEGAKLIGCLACWDQRPYKQVVIRGYSKKYLHFRRFQPFLRLLPGTTIPRLPRVGSRVEQVFFSHLAVANNDPEILKDLMSSHFQSKNDYAFATLSLDTRHPLTPIIKKQFHPITTITHVYTVYRPGDIPQPLEPNRLIHLDAAVL